MSRITITPLGPDRYGVEVSEGEEAKTSHRVTVPPAFLDDLALHDVDPEVIVKESFEFLLEREPASSILGDFQIDAIASYFPEYYDELKLRLSTRG